MLKCSKCTIQDGSTSKFKKSVDEFPVKVQSIDKY